jgi:hypothetical protein
MWRKWFTKYLSLGALVWAMTAMVAVATTVGAARTGQGWKTAVLAIALALGCTMVPWLRAATARAETRRRSRLDGMLTIDARGVTRIVGERREGVAWKDLVSVRIRTTSAGPSAEDMFFVLDDADGRSFVVPNRLAVAARLLTALQERLPGLDNKQVARAAGVVKESWFTIWTRAEDGGKTVASRDLPVGG